MTKKQTQFLKKSFQVLLLPTIILIFTFQACNSTQKGNSFVLDNIQYESNDGGIGYGAKDDNSLDLNKTSFVATFHITNLSKNTINLDSSNFKLINENGTPFSLETKMNDTDISAIYKQKIEPGEAIDYMLTFTVPKEGHYNLHIISPISKTEEVIHY